MPTPNAQSEAADRIIQSDLVSARTADAVMFAERDARGGPVTLDHIRRAAKGVRAKLRVVAAAFGFVRCAHCGEFVHISTDVDLEDFSACSHTLDCECDELEAALAVYVLLTDQPIRPAIMQHAAWTERAKRFGNERPPGPTPLGRVSLRLREGT